MSDTTVTPVNPESVVAKIRYAVKGQKAWSAYVADNGVTRENLAAHAKALAALAFPNDEPVQKTDGKRTRFGNAVQAAAFNLRGAIGTDEDQTDEDKPVNLLTRAGLAATLEEVTAAWEAAQN